MGMYIIGKKPDRCGVCPCFHAENPMYCQAVKAAVQKPRIVRPYANGRPDWCPLIEVPEPHGDLIDKNELTMCRYDLDNYFWFQAVPEETLNEAKVIIPASEEGET